MKTKSSSLPWLSWSLWGLLSFFYAFQYVIRVSPSVMISDILQRFCITACEFGNYSGTYYLGYALAHLPLGWMLDRYPLKWVISGSIFFSVAGLVPLIFGDTWWLAVGGRFLIGAGSSGAILSVFKVLRLYFPAQWFSRLLGLSVTVGLLGAIYGSAPVHYLSQHYGWNNVLMLFLITGLSLAVLAALFIPLKSPPSTSQTSTNVWEECKGVIKNKRVLLTALFAALMVGPLEGFADVWAVPFLEHVYGLSPSFASSLPSFIFIGMCIGAPTLAAIAERFQAYQAVICLSSFLMMVAFILLLFVPLAVWMVGVLFLLIGLLCAYQVLVLTVNGRNVPEQHSTFVTALTNMIIMSFGSVYHNLIGGIIDFKWDGQTFNALPLYSADAYRYGIMVIPLGLGIALIGFIILDKGQLFKKSA